jgi:sugar phosphate isomerase/epimerase
MRLGVNLAVFGDRTLDQALDTVAGLDLDAVELNAEASDPLTPLETLLRDGTRIRRAVESRGLGISAVGNHGESQLLGGPYHGDTDRFCQGSRGEKIAYGRERLLGTARAASEMGVATVIGFVGCEENDPLMQISGLEEFSLQ